MGSHCFQPGRVVDLKFAILSNIFTGSELPSTTPATMAPSPPPADATLNTDKPPDPWLHSKANETKTNPYLCESRRHHPPAQSPSPSPAFMAAAPPLHPSPHQVSDPTAKPQLRPTIRRPTSPASRQKISVSVPTVHQPRQEPESKKQLGRCQQPGLQLVFRRSFSLTLPSNHIRVEEAGCGGDKVLPEAGPNRAPET